MPEKRLCEFVACQKHPSPSGGRAGAGNPFCAATIVTPNGTTVFLPTPALEKEALARPIQNKNACPASEGEKKNGYTGLALAEVSLVPARFLRVLLFPLYWIHTVHSKQPGVCIGRRYYGLVVNGLVLGVYYSRRVGSEGALARACAAGTASAARRLPSTAARGRGRWPRVLLVHF